MREVQFFFPPRSCGMFCIETPLSHSADTRADLHISSAVPRRQIAHLHVFPFWLPVPGSRLATFTDSNRFLANSAPTDLKEMCELLGTEQSVLERAFSYRTVEAKLEKVSTTLNVAQVSHTPTHTHTCRIKRHFFRLACSAGCRPSYISAARSLRKHLSIIDKLSSSRTSECGSHCWRLSSSQPGGDAANSRTSG